MNNKPRLLILLSTVLCYLALSTACKKEHKYLEQERPVVSAGPSGAPGTCGPDSIITGVVSSNLYLKSCKIYKLSGLVYVGNNATITIEPGTVIKGIKSTSSSTPGGGLIITRGSKLIAVGTATDPIIFTSNEATPASGDWSGIILIGKAPTNHTTSVNVEGVPGSSPVDISYGGPTNNVPNDNSGILKYVRIEYAGYELSLGNEMNGLTLAGVGNGTTIDYVEVYKANDDAFQFFGGTVNPTHLLAIHPLDELIETTNGYIGEITYAVGIIDPIRADKSTSHGIESSNDFAGSPNPPITRPTYRYTTVIGLPTQAAASITNGLPSGAGRYGHAVRLIKNTNAIIDKSIFLGFNYGIVIVPGFTPVLSNNYVHGYVLPYAIESAGVFTPFTPGASNFGYITPNPNTNIQLGNPFSPISGIGGLIPGPLSPAKLSGAFPTGNTTWANGWTRL